jgi:hypothetical protein
LELHILPVFGELRIDEIVPMQSRDSLCWLNYFYASRRLDCLMEQTLGICGAECFTERSLQVQLRSRIREWRPQARPISRYSAQWGFSQVHPPVPARIDLSTRSMQKVAANRVSSFSYRRWRRTLAMDASQNRFTRCILTYSLLYLLRYHTV